jgi:hypothetical protein
MNYFIMDGSDSHQANYAAEPGATRNASCHLGDGPEGGCVGLQYFVDAQGIRWQVWEVETPATRAHLMDPNFRNGWLVFEREDGTDRRRLAQVPEDWASLGPERLARLCAAATPAPAARTTPTAPPTIQSPTYLRDT